MYMLDLTSLFFLYIFFHKTRPGKTARKPFRAPSSLDAIASCNMRKIS